MLLEFQYYASLSNSNSILRAYNQMKYQQNHPPKPLVANFCNSTISEMGSSSYTTATKVIRAICSLWSQLFLKVIAGFGEVKLSVLEF